MIRFVSRTTRIALKRVALLAVITALLSSVLLTGSIRSSYADDGGYPWVGASCLDTSSGCDSYNWGYNLVSGQCPSVDTGCLSYPYPNHSNPTGGMGDTWGYGVRNCTSYVAWKINQQYGKNISGWGDAAKWGAGAQSAGYGFDVNPQLGDIAVWNATGSNPYGHVAYVSSVTNNVATLAEYNSGYPKSGSSFQWGLFYNVFTNTNYPAGQPSTFIHIGTPSGGGGGYTGVGSSTYTGGNSMADGTTMLPGYYLASNNVQGALIFQTDSNLVLYDGGNVVWQSGTSGGNANRLVMQTDGNLVMYRADNSVVWQSGTGGHSGTAPYATLQDDGNFVVYSSSGTPYWQSLSGGHANLAYFGSDRQAGGQDQYQNQYLRSADNRYALLLETNGNVVLYSAGYHPLWASYTSSGDTLTMQTDGNLVEYAIGNPVWWTNTSGNPGAYAIMQTDGDFVVYSSSNFPLFASNTGGQI